MSDADQDELADLGQRLAAAAPETFAAVLARLRDIVEAQELIAGFDAQLMLRAHRPTKRYCV